MRKRRREVLYAVCQNSIAIMVDGDDDEDDDDDDDDGICVCYALPASSECGSVGSL